MSFNICPYFISFDECIDFHLISTVSTMSTFYCMLMYFNAFIMFLSFYVFILIPTNVDVVNECNVFHSFIIQFACMNFNVFYVF